MKWEKKPKQKEWWKRSSTEECLSHFFIKTFCKVQKPYCILSVNLKRWKEQGAEGCNFHVYPQVLRRNLPLPYNLIQYLEVQTQIKQRLWSSEIPAEQGVLSWGRKVPAVLEEHECKAAETEDTSSNPLSFTCAKSLIESMGGICHGMPESCWSACQPALLASSALGEHTLPGLEGWEWMQQPGRDQAEEALLTSPVLLSTGENAAAAKTPKENRPCCWRYWKVIWTLSCATGSRWTCLSREVDKTLGGLFPFQIFCGPTILFFYLKAIIQVGCLLMASISGA